MVVGVQEIVREWALAVGAAPRNRLGGRGWPGFSGYRSPMTPMCEEFDASLRGHIRTVSRGWPAATTIEPLIWTEPCIDFSISFARLLSSITL